MPTILELFKGSTFDTSVKADKDTVFEFETTGIRPRSAVELNNPLIYGNQAIRIANRSTSAVELMKGDTGGTPATGGLIGQGLGAITAGGFGRFVFGGQVSSLNQARDGINSRLGIPQLLIPTFVKNTGELQKGIEPDTMITIAKIKNDGAGTLLGRFLKQTGGGNPKTIGRQALGQGISLVKDKIREQLFGNPASMGSNTAKPVNGGWEYSSKNPYSEQIREVQTDEVSLDKLATPDKEVTDNLQKVTQTKEDAKKKLGEPAGSLKNKLKGTSNNPALDAAVEQSTLENAIPSPDLKYSETLGNYKVDYQEANTPIIDLSLVSPVYGVDRKDSGGRYGKTEYGFSDVRNNTGVYSPYNPTEGANYTAGNKASWQTTYGLDKGDTITQSPIKTRTDEETKILENQDLIPFWIKSKRSSRSAHFRSYVTGITETSSPSWNSSKFFGNPFSFYTYDGVERSVSFTLNVICLNSSELASNWEKLEFLTAQTYPTFTNNFVNPPIVSFRLGDMYKDKISYIESLSYTLPDNGTWETNIDGLLLPKFIDVSISFKFIEQRVSEDTIYSFKRTKDAIQFINEKNSGGGSFTTDSITVTETPTPPKVDESGVPITEGTEGGVNKPQQNLETGKTDPTPKEEQSGEVVTGDNTTSKAVVEKNERLEQAKQLFPNTSLYTQTFFANDLNLDLDSVKKIPSDQAYKSELGDVYYIYNKNGYDKDWAYVVTSTGSSGGSYKSWVANDNNGYDPLGILKDFTNGTPPPQPAPIAPIDENRRRKKKR
jgi:hypothetical protein